MCVLSHGFTALKLHAGGDGETVGVSFDRTLLSLSRQHPLKLRAERRQDFLKSLHLSTYVLPF